jgi:hypothetical protein
MIIGITHDSDGRAIERLPVSTKVACPKRRPQPPEQAGLVRLPKKEKGRRRYGMGTGCIFESYHTRNRTMLTSPSCFEVPILKGVDPERNILRERFAELGRR